MPRGKNYVIRPEPGSVCRFHSFDLATIQYETGHTCIKVNFPAMRQDALPHRCNNGWKLIGTDMRMGFYKNITGSTKAHQQF